VETLGLSANGAKCESLGRRPRWDELKIFLALQARNVAGPFIVTTIFELAQVFRAFSAFRNSRTFNWGAAPGCYISRLWR
jgi:hypothetical protein